MKTTYIPNLKQTTKIVNPKGLCPVCGAHLASWREMFGEEHRCPEPEAKELVK